MSLNLEHCLRIARQIARESGTLMLTAFHLPKKVEFKGRTDLVTETDKKIEEYVCAQLKAYFPSHKFLGEETMAALQAAGKPAVEELTSEPTWVVDPVDGTTNFVHSIPYSCVSIALVVEHEAVLGVVFNPVSGEMFTAIKGQGAFRNDAPISVSDNQELVQAVVATGIPHDKSYLREFVQGNLQTIQTHCQSQLSPSLFLRPFPLHPFALLREMCKFLIRSFFFVFSLFFV